jgi:hypothetical protein
MQKNNTDGNKNTGGNRIPVKTRMTTTIPMKTAKRKNANENNRICTNPINNANENRRMKKNNNAKEPSNSNTGESNGAITNVPPMTIIIL